MIIHPKTDQPISQLQKPFDKCRCSWANATYSLSFCNIPVSATLPDESVTEGALILVAIPRRGEVQRSVDKDGRDRSWLDLQRWWCKFHVPHLVAALHDCPHDLCLVPELRQGDGGVSPGIAPEMAQNLGIGRPFSPLPDVDQKSFSCKK